MKKVTLFICLPVLLLAGNLKDSLLKAKREQKPVMVYVVAESCQYCEKMKIQTISSATVQQNIGDFIFTEVDKEDPEAKKYLPSTRYTPTVYFISPKFKVVNTVKGYLGKEDFNLWVNDSKAKLGIASKGVSTAVVTAETQSDVWMYDMASAIDFATQTGKQVMVYIENSSSTWSQKMRQETFADESVKNALEDFVWVKLQKGSSEAVNNDFNPEIAPTVYFVKPNGTPLATAKGYFAAKDFLLWANYAKSKI